MPSKSSKRSNSKTTRRVKRPTTRTIARQEAIKVVNKVVETKILDTNATAVAVDYTNGYVVSLTNTMIRGIGESQYIGDSILPVGVKIRMQFTRADATQLIRFLVIQNKAGGIPIVGTTFSSTANVTAPLSMYDIDYQNTYRVLVDRLLSFDNIRDTTRIMNVTIPAKRLRKMYFNDAIGTIEKAGIYMVLISDSAIAAHPAFDYRARLYYKDA